MQDFTKEEEAYIRDLAEKAVKIKEGQPVGTWTREKRVALVYAVLCGLFRQKKQAQ